MIVSNKPGLIRTIASRAWQYLSAVLNTSFYSLRLSHPIPIAVTVRWNWSLFNGKRWKFHGIFNLPKIGIGMSQSIRISCDSDCHRCLNRRHLVNDSGGREGGRESASERTIEKERTNWMVLPSASQHARKYFVYFYLFIYFIWLFRVSHRNQSSSTAERFWTF